MPETETVAPVAAPLPAGVDARCARCGYCVRGVVGLTCPECGSDLREVGIRSRRRLGTGVVALLWTLALPVPALFLWAWFYNAAAPRVHTLRQERMIESVYFGKKIRATLEGSQPGWGAPIPAHDIPPERLVLRLDAPAAPHPDLVVDLPSRSYSFRKPDGTLATGTAFNPGPFLICLSPFGIKEDGGAQTLPAGPVVDATEDISL